MTALVYQNHAIRREGDMLSLTDMWRAGGADPAKQPGKWRKLPSTREFVAHVADVILQKSEDLVVFTERGRTGGTWGHWQIAIAYAKYLSHAFHAWCNDAVRSLMDGSVESPAGLRSEPSAGLRELSLREIDSKEKLVGRMLQMKGPSYAFALYQGLGLPVFEPEKLPLTEQAAVAERRFEADPIARTVLAVAESYRTWVGTANQLLAELNREAQPEDRTHPRWPRSSQSLGIGLRLAKGMLAERGVIIEYRHSGIRTITLTMADGE